MRGFPSYPVHLKMETEGILKFGSSDEPQLMNEVILNNVTYPIKKKRENLVKFSHFQFTAVDPEPPRE
jgi:hypothetical protein